MTRPFLPVLITGLAGSLVWLTGCRNWPVNGGADVTVNCEAYTLSSPSFTCHTTWTVVVPPVVEALISAKISLPAVFVICRKVPSTTSYTKMWDCEPS